MGEVSVPKINLFLVRPCSSPLFSGLQNTYAQWRQSTLLSLLLHAPHVARRVVISTRATNARWSNIAMQHAKRNIGLSIRNNARNELLSYTMKLYSKSVHLRKIVLSAFSPCHWIQSKQISNHVAEKISVWVVFMR